MDYRKLMGVDYSRLQERVENGVVVAVELYDGNNELITVKKSWGDFFVKSNTMAENVYAANMLVKDYETGFETWESIEKLSNMIVNSALRWGRDYNGSDCTLWGEFMDGSVLAIHNEGQTAFDAFVTLS